MQKKIEDTIGTLAEALGSWPEVEAVTLAKSVDEDIFSPYYFISVDIFHRGILPLEEDRVKALGYPQAFETNVAGTKDRFLFQDLPVRLEYKRTQRIDEVLASAQQPLYSFKEDGTYPLYRLAYNQILFSRSNWLPNIRESLRRLPVSFWVSLISACRTELEHKTMDISEAVLAQDELFFLRSLASYVNSVCSYLFLINRQFEPSGRRLQDKVLALPALPENFQGRFECLVKEDPEFDPSRKMELAALLTKSLLTMLQDKQ